MIRKRMSTVESFDDYDLTGTDAMAPLVQVTASPDNAWFKNIMSP